jgi:hypothetical protein
MAEVYPCARLELRLVGEEFQSEEDDIAEDCC